MTLASAAAQRRTVDGLLRSIRAESVPVGRDLTFMEVCGTHTHSVGKAGLRRLLPSTVRLISGPGCPVCVTPVGFLDRAVALARLPDTMVATFGDLMRVPSSTTSLERAQAEGASVHVVYSPRDAVALARQRPDLRVVFLSVGFETTTPTIAGALAEAEADGIDNFMVLAGNKIIPPAMEALVRDEELSLDGFLLPGHVSVITGWHAFRFLAAEHGLPGAVVGFQPVDILHGLLELVRQQRASEPTVVNLYGRVVSAEGNRAAQQLVERMFTPATTAWRGFGDIPASGLVLRPEWSHRDAARIEVDLPEPQEPVGCRCGDVLRGVIDPPECPIFGSSCTPDDPVGACMVSSEGTCAAWYRHEGLEMFQ